MDWLVARAESEFGQETHFLLLLLLLFSLFSLSLLHLFSFFLLFIMPKFLGVGVGTPKLPAPRWLRPWLVALERTLGLRFSKRCVYIYGYHNEAL